MGLIARNINMAGRLRGVFPQVPPPPPAPNIVTDGLIMNLDAGNAASYPGSGNTWADISGNSNNCQLVNSPTFNSANSGSLVFNGINQHIITPISVLPSGTNNFTYSIWVNLNAVTGNLGPDYYGAILLSGNTGGTIEVYIGSIKPSNIPAFISSSRFGGGTVGGAGASTNMSLNSWNNIVYLRDGPASQKIYLNGSLIGTGNISNSFSSNYGWIAGATTDPQYNAFLNGRIAQIGMYNRALNQSEITQNFNALRGRYGL